jgi:hypothetical protein
VSHQSSIIGSSHSHDTFTSHEFQIRSFETARIGEGAPLPHEGKIIDDEERNGLEIAAAAIGQPQRIGQVPFYTGKQDNRDSERAIAQANLLCRRTHWANVRLGYLLIRSVFIKTRSHSVKCINVSAR